MTSPASFFIVPSRQPYVNANGTPTREFFQFLTNLVNSLGQGQPLGTAAFANTGTSGLAVPLLNAANTWSGVQNFGDGDVVLDGATSGKTTLHASAIAAATDITFPALTDTVVLVTAVQSLTNKTIQSQANTLDAIQLIGTNTNSNANAGNMGELIDSTVLVGSAIGLTSTSPADITTLSLTAGDWDVWGTVAFSPNAATTITNLQGWINTTSVTRPTPPGLGAVVIHNISFATGGSQVFPVGQVRLSLASTTTVYLSCNSVFGTNTLSAYGYIGARRRR